MVQIVKKYRKTTLIVCKNLSRKKMALLVFNLNNSSFCGRRYYSPALGRFITPDPQGFSDGPTSTPTFTTIRSPTSICMGCGICVEDLQTQRIFYGV